MNKVSNILVIVDPTAAAHPALDKAARLATAFDARLQLFACETQETRAPHPAAISQERGEGELVADTCARLEPIGESLRKQGVDASIDVISGHPLHVRLLERTKATCADLVVKDTHHHSLARRTFLTNTDWHLIRGCPVPLLLTKPRAWSPAPVLLAAIDPGHADDKPAALDTCILECAAELRRRLDAAIRVLHAFVPTILTAEAASGMPVLAGDLTQELVDEERKAKRAEVGRLCALHGIEGQDIAIELGSATEALVRFANDVNADVVIMGAIARSAIRRALIGSTAERVLEYLPCDVLIVKPPDFAESLPF